MAATTLVAAGHMSTEEDTTAAPASAEAEAKSAVEKRAAAEKPSA